jgi:branched-chain amino acid transport system ATP-binding protein
MIGADTNTWGCGWCKRKGGPEELKAFVIERTCFEVGAGALVCLIGRNGAGKTTTLRAIMGRPSSGTVKLSGRNIVGLRPFEVARLGVGFAPSIG